MRDCSSVIGRKPHIRNVWYKILILLNFWFQKFRRNSFFFLFQK